MEIGKKYKLKKYSSITLLNSNHWFGKEEFRGKEFTLTRIDDVRAYIKIEGDNDIRNFMIERWDDYVVSDGPSWTGNKLLFKFI